MAWCKLEDSFRANRKFKRLAKRLGVRNAEARGLLTALWSWCTTNAPDGNLIGMTTDEIEEAMDWGGKSGEAVKACLSPEIGLLDEVDGHFEVHDWWSFAGSYKRAVQKRDERKRRTEKDGN